MTSTLPDEIRVGVLGAIARGMSFSYAARADGITIAQAEEIARDAGWPDATRLYVTWRDLREQGAEQSRPVVPQRPKPAKRVQVGALLPVAHPPELPVQPPEPEPAPPAPPAGPQPCEVCGITVAAAYIERTGRARHGHHPETTG